jgi:ParB family chromosome partitioning protein
VKRPRRKKAEPKSVGLQPADCVGAPPSEIEALSKQVAAAGGVGLASYREPLGGQWLMLAALPLDVVTPTPFQRDLSETHAKRLADSIAKLGQYLDPVIAVPHEKGFWTPNGMHRLEAMKRSGAKTITALVLPDARLQYKILALNVEKAHNLREKSLEVVRMAKGMPAAEKETDHAFEFEEPHFITLGLCYEKNGRFAGGAYASILKRLDGFLEETLAKSLKIRESRAAKIEKLDGIVTEKVKELQAKGFKSPYLKGFVIARCNALRFLKVMPEYDEGIDDILSKAAKFTVDKVKPEDIAATAPVAEGGE